VAEHPGLELHSFLEACYKFLFCGIDISVNQANAQIPNLCERFPRTHGLHDVRVRPNCHFVLLLQHPHGIIKPSLVATIRFDMPMGAAHYDRIHVPEQLEEIIVLRVHVMNEIASDASIDQTIAKRNRVVAVAVTAFIRTTKFMCLYVDLYKTGAPVGWRGLRE
jgi:hypothetical protein